MNSASKAGEAVAGPGVYAEIDAAYELVNELICRVDAIQRLAAHFSHQASELYFGPERELPAPVREARDAVIAGLVAIESIGEKAVADGEEIARRIARMHQGDDSAPDA